MDFNVKKQYDTNGNINFYEDKNGNGQLDKSEEIIGTIDFSGKNKGEKAVLNVKSENLGKLTEQLDQLGYDSNKSIFTKGQIPKTDQKDLSLKLSIKDPIEPVKDPDINAAKENLKAAEKNYDIECERIDTCKDEALEKANVEYQKQINDIKTKEQEHDLVGESYENELKRVNEDYEKTQQFIKEASEKESAVQKDKLEKTKNAVSEYEKTMTEAYNGYKGGFLGAGKTVSNEDYRQIKLAAKEKFEKSTQEIDPPIVQSKTGSNRQDSPAKEIEQEKPAKVENNESVAVEHGPEEKPKSKLELAKQKYEEKNAEYQKMQQNPDYDTMSPADQKAYDKKLAQMHQEVSDLQSDVQKLSKTNSNKQVESKEDKSAEQSKSNSEISYDADYRRKDKESYYKLMGSIYKGPISASYAIGNDVGSFMSISYDFLNKMLGVDPNSVNAGGNATASADKPESKPLEDTKDKTPENPTKTSDDSSKTKASSEDKTEKPKTESVSQEAPAEKKKTIKPNGNPTKIKTPAQKTKELAASVRDDVIKVKKDQIQGCENNIKELDKELEAENKEVDENKMIRDPKKKSSAKKLNKISYDAKKKQQLDKIKRHNEEIENIKKLKDQEILDNYLTKDLEKPWYEKVFD